MLNNMRDQKERSGIKSFFDVSDVSKYFFRRRNNEKKPDFNLRVMHWINKVSIIIFLLAILFLIIRNLIWN